MSEHEATDPIAGSRVLLPRGGRWGEDATERLAEAGAEAVVVPLVEFAPPEDPAPLNAAIDRLNAGFYDWILVTSPTAIDAVIDAGAVVPASTKVAVLGEIVASAATAVGWNVVFRPVVHHSHQGLVTEWPDPRPGDRVLIPQSQVADQTLLEGLGSLGLEVERVTAYRAISVAPPPELVADVAAGGFDAVAITGGSIAARVADEFAPLPDSTRVVCIGPRTAGEASTSGLTVAAVAQDRNASALVEALRSVARTRQV